MSTRQRRLLAGAAVVSLLVLVAVGLTRADGTDGRPCPQRVGTAALGSPYSEDPCVLESQRRAYGALASLMGLVLISGLLSRER